MNIEERFIQSIDNLLSPDECKHFIDLLDNDSLVDVERPDLAYYQRNIWINDAFADTIYNRIQSYLPIGTKRCNEYFRFSKYVPGQEFRLHTDGTNMDRYGNHSKYTVNIFLNEGFMGGETDFFNYEGRPVFRAKPHVGRAMLFDREIYHCGRKVIVGTKYLLRTDVMIPIERSEEDTSSYKEITLVA